VYFFAYTGMQIPAGVLVDKFGQKAVLIPAFIGFAIGAVVLGTAGSLPQVYIGSLISGIATGSYYGLMGKLAIDPVLITYVSDSVPEQKTAKALGLFNFFGMVSSVVAPWLTGYIGDVTGSQVLAFYIGSILRSEEHTSELQSRFDLVCRRLILILFPTRRSSDLNGETCNRSCVNHVRIRFCSGAKNSQSSWPVQLLRYGIISRGTLADRLYR